MVYDIGHRRSRNSNKQQHNDSNTIHMFIYLFTHHSNYGIKYNHNNSHHNKNTDSRVSMNIHDFRGYR